MKKSITIILVLMSICVICITGLQLFWNYQNYTNTVTSFQHTINESLYKAVEDEMSQRREQIIVMFKSWLADTSMITITCDIKNLDSNTVFHFKDRYPRFAGGKGMSFGIADFHQKLTTLTPEAKKLAIDRFADRILRKDLEKGMIYYYTQRLGDRLAAASNDSQVNMGALNSIYKNALLSKGIKTWFTFDKMNNGRTYYRSKSVNTDFRRPFKKAMVQALFENPDIYFLKSMKWVIITTFILITITMFCYGYTAKTLLSQHKLAELKDNFINNMTHELNTPLTSIKITAEALKSFDYSPDKQKEYLQIISYQAEKLTDLSSHILNTNRRVITSRETWEIIDLNALIQKAIQDQSILFDQKAAVITYSPVTGIMVYGDAGNLLNIFTNMIDNAVKYTTLPPVITILLVRLEKSAEVTFSDNGIGIPAAYHEMIFEPFFRVAQDKIHDVKGYGLGLSYVSQVIRQHKGAISIQANQPYGSQFKISIPLL